MNGSKREWPLWIAFHVAMALICAGFIVITFAVATLFLMVVSPPLEADEPMILHDHGQIITGTIGDDPVNLTRAGHYTFGTIGDQTVVINNWTLRREQQTHESRTLQAYTWQSSEELPYLQPAEEFEEGAGEEGLQEEDR